LIETLTKLVLVDGVINEKELIETLTKLVLVDGVINEKKTLTGDEKSLVEAHRKSAKYWI
jgi:hypothetical protein